MRTTGTIANGVELLDYFGGKPHEIDLGQVLLAQLDEIDALEGEQTTPLEKAGLPFDPCREFLWG